MRTRALVSASVVMFVATMVVRAQQAPPANLVPMTAASLAAQPDRYLGQIVAVYATVESLVSKTAFSVDQNPQGAGPADILIIAPNLNIHPRPNEYITVIGEAMRLDAAALAAKAQGYTLDLPPDAITRYQGKPMVLATSVVDGSMTELAKFIPPPMTPEDAAFDAVMKQVNPTFGEMRKGLEASDAAIVKTQGTKLRDLFAETRTFFTRRSVPDARGWAGDAVALVETVTKGAAAGDWAAAKEAASKIQPLCAQCHNAQRERLEDGSYRVKPAG